MTQTIVWKGLMYPSMECCCIAYGESGITVRGTVVGCDEGRPFNIDYAIDLQASWQIGSFSIQNNLSPQLDLQTFVTDDNGNWYNSADNTIVAAGCEAIDISLTPFTNTLSIRKLALQPGETGEIKVLYADIQACTLYATTQHYTRLTEDTYRFSTEDGSFMADITVDSDMTVTYYKQLFERVSCG